MKIMTDEPSADYWKLLAETRRQALDETLKENEELHEELTATKNDVTAINEELEHARAEIAGLKSSIEGLEQKVSHYQTEIELMEEIVNDAKQVSLMLQVSDSKSCGQLK
jgi:predicted nuclease with TOPRIM domain